MRTSGWSMALVLGLGASVVGCPPEANGPSGGSPATSLDLPGVDTSELTNRERGQWATMVAELLAPCPELALTIRECVEQQSPCPACSLAARFLVRQVRSGKPRSLVVEVFDARFDPQQVKTIAIGDSPASGPANAPVQIVEFADFQCPACAAVSELLDGVQERFPGQVSLVYKHFPISYHTHAVAAARASIAAQRQGKFWPMHHTLYHNRDALTDTDLVGYARELGLDVDRFEHDFEDVTVGQVVERDRRQGESLGVRGTPAIFINGREVPMGLMQDPVADLDDWVRTEIELVGGSAPRASSAAPRPSPPPAASSEAQP